MSYRTALLPDHWSGMIRIIFAAVSALAVPLTLSAVLLAVSSVTLRPSTVTAGGQSGGTVTIDAPAAGQVLVALSSSNPSVAQVPSNTFVDGRTRTGTFPVSTSSPGCASISARAGATAPRSAVLFVNPATPTNVSLVQISLATNQVIGGQSTSGSVTVSRVGGTVRLVSSNPLVTVPAIVSVPSANTPVSFPIRTSAVTTPTCSLITATTATIASGSRSALLQVLPSAG